MEEIVFNDLKLDLDAKVLYIKNKLVNLTKHEYFILKFLLENKNKIFTRQELLNVLNKPFVSLRVIDTLISRLRKKLEEYGIYIKTKTGFGYGFFTN